ncbi:hypothetical protein ANO14919_067400 [Xylariales sp. No.14919]|nr:hypothetical protein ANO14919_067400 [Xylariales sp. No.14919]
MDVQDDLFDTKVAGVNKATAAIDHAVILCLADYSTTPQTRHVILAVYVSLVLYNTMNDVRWSIIQSLSLVVLWACFYSNGDFSLMSLYGTHLITKMTLMTFGNASLWVTIPGVRFDARSIVLGNFELAAYVLSWAGLSLTGCILNYFTRPFQRVPAVGQAIIATILVQIMVIGLDKTSSSTRQRARQSQNLNDQRRVSDDEIDENTLLMYARGGELSSGKTIRLVRLLPRSDGEETRCEMVGRDLEKVFGDYEAISYTWGNAKEQAIIQMDGRPVRVPRKVFEMLQVLRHAGKPRMLWIDNLCINQADTNEKSHQITLMRHIYYRAIAVIIWLDPSPDTTVAIDLLVEIASSRGLTGVQGSFLYGQRDQQQRLLALARLIENDYFNRLWVVQEIASARNLQVLCGAQSIRWEDLNFVLRFMGNPDMLRSLQRTEEMGVVACNQDSLRHATTLIATKASISRGISSSLAFVLCNFRSLKCKDPRDKVYGLLGLVRSIDHPLIRPDYNKSEIQLYKDVAKYVFTVEKTSRKLLALPFAGVGHCRRLQELPSWVPDWASNARRKHTEDEDKTQVDDRPSPNQSNFSYHIQPWSNYGNITDIMKPDQADFRPTGLTLGYQAALDTEADIKLVGDDVLGIRGFVVDEIQSLTSVFDIPFDETMRISHTIMTLAMLAWFEEAETLAFNVPSPYPTGQSIEDVVWRTMIGDRLLEADDSQVVRPAPSDYGLIYQDYKQAAIGLRRACSIMDMETVSEMRDIWHEMFVQIIGGGSVFKILVEVLCGRSGHTNVWRLITTGTKFANDGTLRPHFPRGCGDAEFWAGRFEELCENEETKELVATLVVLFGVFLPEHSSDNSPKEARRDSFDDRGRDNNAEAADTTLEQKLAGMARLGPAISRFPEGLRISFERRLCVTKNGYVGLVPPLTHVGDLVTILHGGDAPYLVRPETRLETQPVVEGEVGIIHGQLVGECYMHGMMDGEMVGLREASLWFHLT